MNDINYDSTMNIVETGFVNIQLECRNRYGNWIGLTSPSGSAQISRKVAPSRTQLVDKLFIQGHGFKRDFIPLKSWFEKKNQIFFDKRNPTK